MADLAKLSAAVRSCVPDDPDGVAAVQDMLVDALTCQPQDAAFCEPLMTCILESFTAAGENGKELLDQVLLDVLPHMTPLAGLSQACGDALSSFCSLAAAACSPRDTITTFLEVMDTLSPDSASSPVVLQCLVSLLILLPQQLVKLSRRKAAFATECLVPAAALAKAHGDVLQGWMMTQLKLAATCGSTSTPGTTASAAGVADAACGAGDILRRLDIFLAANWRMYEDFVSELLHKVLPQEPDASDQQSCKQAVSNLILHLLLHLTASWPPPVLAGMAAQLLSAPIAAPLPSAASVLAPDPMLLLLAAGSGQAVKSQSNAVKLAAGSDSQALSGPNTDTRAGCSAPATAAVAAATAGAGADVGLQGLDNGSAEASAVVLSLLQLLQECGMTSWQALAGRDGEEAAGAALAALYSSCLDGEPFEMPGAAVETMQVACRWCAALSDASEGNPLVILKVIALLQLAAAHAADLQAAPAASAAPAAPHNEPPADASLAAASSASILGPPGSVLKVAGDDAAAAAAAATRLLPHLEPCISLLASTIASGVGPALRSQATLALQQLLKAPGPDVCYCCLQELLAGGGRRVHPEVAALLMQEVRQQLVRTQGPGPFSSTASVQLVLPWLLQNSAVGWRDTEQLSVHANAICAALAVVRLGLLKSRPAAAAAAAADTAAAADGCAYKELQALLQGPLQALSAVVSEALHGLQLQNKAEQGSGQLGQERGSAQQQQGEQVPVRIPGDAQGSGQAVDAWLAVSRVQDVLDRVLELL